MDFSKLAEARKAPVPAYGDLMTLEEFCSAVAEGVFVDYDGHGSPATKSNIWCSHGILDWEYMKIYPSEVTPDFVGQCVNNGITHVCWYNK